MGARIGVGPWPPRTRLPSGPRQPRRLRRRLPSDTTSFSGVTTMPRSTTVLGAALRPVLAGALAALAVSAATGLPAARAAAPTVDLQPQALARGADIAVPHIEDGDFVDGARRIELPGTDGAVLGASGAAWLAAHLDEQPGRRAATGRVVRVEPDGTVVDVLRNFEARWALLLSRTAARCLAWRTPATAGRQGDHVRSATDGSERPQPGLRRLAPGLSTADDRRSSVADDATHRALARRAGPRTDRDARRRRHRQHRARPARHLHRGPLPRRVHAAGTAERPERRPCGGPAGSASRPSRRTARSC